MQRLYWIRFCDEWGNLLIKSEYNKLFSSEKHLNRFISKEKADCEQLIEMRVREDPYYREVPRIDQIKDVAGLVCQYMDLPREGVLSKVKRREFAYARKFISNICLDMGFMHDDISERTGFERTSIYAHQKSLQNLIQTDKSIRKDYLDIKEMVRKKLNGIYSEDGSGQIIKH